MKKIIMIGVLLLMAGSAMGQQCVSGTGNNATVIVPASVVTNIQTDDVILARHDTLCVGQVVYQEEVVVVLTVWGDNEITPEIDGIPTGALIQ